MTYEVQPSMFLPLANICFSSRGQEGAIDVCCIQCMHAVVPYGYSYTHYSLVSPPGQGGGEEPKNMQITIILSKLLCHAHNNNDNHHINNDDLTMTTTRLACCGRRHCCGYGVDAVLIKATKPNNKSAW